MSRYDFRSPRLFVNVPLTAGGVVPLDRAQANYLGNVLRLKAGDNVLVFNGRDGEWRARLEPGGRRPANLVAETRIRNQTRPADLALWFAPLKHARLDYVVQKAVEMGVSQLQPMLTQHTQVSRLNLDRMRANVVEAAEQCGILALPEVAAEQPLHRLLEQAGQDRLAIFCDEDADIADPVAALAAHRAAGPRRPLAVLIGPEGGFSVEERQRLLARPQIVRLALGPRILRADTAAVAALALVQAVLGDWA